MKIIKQSYLPIPNNTVRVIIVREGKNVIYQTTSQTEFNMLSALAMYNEQNKEKYAAKRLPKSQFSTADAPAQGQRHLTQEEAQGST